MKETDNVKKDSPVSTVERSGFKPISIYDLVVAKLPADDSVEVLRSANSESGESS